MQPHSDQRQQMAAAAYPAILTAALVIGSFKLRIPIVTFPPTTEYFFVKYLYFEIFILQLKTTI